MFHHELEDTQIVSRLEKNGYGSLQPAIAPNKLEKLCEGDPILEKCLQSMFEYSNRYAHDVYSMMIEQMELLEKKQTKDDTPEDYEALRETDKRRHNLHEALIGSINLLSRELGKREKDIEWMRDLVAEGRAGYSRFALLTFYHTHVTMK